MKKEIQTIKEVLIELADVIQSGDFNRRYFREKGKDREWDLVNWVTERLFTKTANHTCCDGECNHDDCCGKVESNCPKRV